MTFKIDEQAAHKVIQWLFSGDSGVSSKTMAAVALGVEKRDGFGYDAPYDPSDFGRCYRLVNAVPEIRSVFPAIASRAPKFKEILEKWDELCVLYERDKPSGKSTELYQRIRQLRGD